MFKTLTTVITEAVQAKKFDNDVRNQMIAATDSMIDAARTGQALEIEAEVATLTEIVQTSADLLGGETSEVYFTLVESLLKINDILSVSLDDILKTDEDRTVLHSKSPQRFRSFLSPRQWNQKPKCLTIDDKEINGYLTSGSALTLDVENKKFSFTAIQEKLRQSGIDGVAYCDASITSKVLQARISIGKFLLVPIPNLYKKHKVHFVFSDGADKGKLEIFFAQQKDLKSLLRNMEILEVIKSVKHDSQSTLAYQAWSKFYGVNESFATWLEAYNKDLLMRMIQHHDPKALKALVGNIDEDSEVNGFNVIYHQLVRSNFKLTDKRLVDELNKAIKSWIQTIFNGKKRFLPDSAFLSTTKDPFAHEQRFAPENRQVEMKGIKAGYVVLPVQGDDGNYYLMNGQTFKVRYPFGDIREVNFKECAHLPEHFESVEAYEYYTNWINLNALCGCLVFSHHDSTEFQQGADWDRDPMLVCWNKEANEHARKM